jgi:hypothetical protein
MSREASTGGARVQLLPACSCRLLLFPLPACLPAPASPPACLPLPSGCLLFNVESTVAKRTGSLVREKSRRRGSSKAQQWKQYS